MTITPSLSLIILTPLVGLIALFAVNREKTSLIRTIALASTLAPFLLSIWVLINYNRAVGDFQFVEKTPWIPALGINFHLGVDGINSLMLVLLGITSFSATLISHSIKDRVKEYYILLLLAVVGTYANFLSLDMFFFFFFHEVAAVPVFLMMLIWGSKNRAYAATKLTLYLTAGGALALIGIIALFHATGLNSFDMPAIHTYIASNPIPIGIQNWIFPMIVIGFGITLTLFPFYTWAPVGYAEAPTAISMLHAGVLKKMGAYAIIRFAIQLMPEAAQTWMPIIAVLALVNIIFCGLVALTQRDLKYLLAYSSCSHMGYILLGLACFSVIGLNGVVFLMFAHGVMGALAFALAGYVEEQAKTRNLDELSGILKRLPFIGTCFMMAAFASAGVPGFGNFVAEVLVLTAAWDNYRWLAVGAVLGIVITAIYMLKAIRLGFHGELNPKLSSLADATSAAAKFPYVLLMAALILVGCLPGLIINHIETSTKPIIKGINMSLDLSAGAQK